MIQAEEIIVWQGESQDVPIWDVARFVRIGLSLAFWSVLLFAAIVRSKHIIDWPFLGLLVVIAVVALELFGRQRMKRRSAAYSISEKHVIIHCKYPEEEILKISLDEAALLMTLRMHTQRVGTIYFGVPAPMMEMEDADTPDPPAFEQIDGAQQVFELIRSMTGKI